MTIARSELRADAARNRAALLDVAREALEHEGALPPLADLARRAGVGVGTAYRHFPTTDSVLAGLGEEGMRDLLATVRSAAAIPDPRSGLAKVIASVVDSALADPGVAMILEGMEQEDGELSPLATELAEVVDGLVARARAVGAIRRGLGTDDVRRLVTGLVHALRGVRERPDPDSYVRVLLDGMRDPSSGAGGTG
ncbi:TetR/AcrR family transcriptional regulator [Promicromonospora sp. NPDC019610]|uniref:TetR/AcrR family transcriptional regulator n=1 Tax=Promicromonospora sp. NPDC019610 TaxID=3364405 RepID=UPI00378B1B4B